VSVISVGAPRRSRKPSSVSKGPITSILLPHCGKIGPLLDAKALRRIEQRLKRRDVAAFVREPISINLGDNDAPRRRGAEYEVQSLPAESRGETSL
jgi:hypothetical protein